MSAKKWTRKTVKDKVDYPTLLADQAAKDEIVKSISKQKYLTPSIVSDRNHITVSLAKRLIRELVAKQEFIPVSVHSKLTVYKNASL